MHALRASPAAYVACFRNATAVTRHLVGRHRRVVLVGATSRGEFREEDQMCSAWIAASLIEAGYRAQDRRTAEIVERWGSASPDACARGRSAGYLRRTDQLDDLEFILTHVDDVDAVFAIEGDEVVARPDHARWPGLPAASVVGRP
jgi:2-phosphosulfolactate phosphatase